MAPEDVVTFVPDAAAWDWMQSNIPFFACPDGDVEQIYYYRWWAYRKHIEKTPAGFIITEFLKPVKHAGEYKMCIRDRCIPVRRSCSRPVADHP